MSFAQHFTPSMDFISNIMQFNLVGIALEGQKKLLSQGSNLLILLHY